MGETKDFNETLQILMGRYSTFPFFRVHVGPSPFDPKTNIIQVSVLKKEHYQERPVSKESDQGLLKLSLCSALKNLRFPKVKAS